MPCPSLAPLGLATALSPILWTALGSVVVVVAIAIGLRSRRPRPSDPEAGPRPLDPAAAGLTALAPLAPSVGPPEGAPEASASPEEEGPLLARIPADSTEWMEGEALEIDGALPERPLRPVADLLAVLSAGDPGACHEAVAELVRHGAGAVPALEALVRDGDPDARVDAARALALIRGETD